jgi:hypothetical protein
VKTFKIMKKIILILLLCITVVLKVKASVSHIPCDIVDNGYIITDPILTCSADEEDEKIIKDQKNKSKDPDTVEVEAILLKNENDKDLCYSFD